ncbi:MAG: adenosylhomocysteinase [Candidatus Thermoplasmatota archaeon]|nr:adenosylhomocysteinase [Candidatus Thermoplasmatota archaeon]
MDYDTKDAKDRKLIESGSLRIEWAYNQMPVLALIRKRFEKEKPLKNITIGACLHVTSETANLVRTLKAGGAKIALCASNPLSTQDSVASALVAIDKVAVFAICGEDAKTYYKHVHKVLDHKPDITMDDGGDLVTTLHTKRAELLTNLIGGTEETTTGVLRFRSMEKEGALRYPIIAVNDANTKHLFDNRYGTGQSTIDGILRSTNILLAGKKLVVLGYGYCGRGIALRAKGMGADVIITEVSPLKALEAVMDGFRVMPSIEAAKIGDIFVTVTGDKSVLRKEHFKVMKNNAILANSGHFNVEIDIPDLESLAVKKRKIREFVEEYSLKDGKRIYLLGEGRLINLAAAEGHPASVMDMSFANQALCVEYLKKWGRKLEPKVYAVPEEIDNEVANLKLQSMGIEIDKLTEEQKKYLKSWSYGT